ncbi:ketopantoate reductase family protein [Falsiroseomonas sp. HW251]|uniref:ketopantoate reductase family protein n=1 Tax=Falsiroseomonas sp. HW251 TaxID=3390998 RepID=UPI003D3232C1
MGIVIIGAGAIGGSLGACLIRAGEHVLLVDRDAVHVATMNAEGLRLEGRETFGVAARAVLPEALEAALGGAVPKTVVLATKSQHTEAALSPVVPLLGEHSVVLSLQNGLNPHEVAALAGPRRTIAACINSMAADWQAPGLILFGGPGTMRIGELDGSVTPRVQELADLLRRHYVANTAVTDNVWGHLWGKEAYGAWLFAQAVSGAPVAEVLDAPENASMLANLAAEVIAVAEAEGVRVEAVDQFVPAAVRFGVPREDSALRRCLSDMAALNRRSQKPRSGIWRDLAVRKRSTEVDAQLGIVVRLGAKHAIPTPLVAKLTDIIHALERQEIPMGEANLAALRAVDAAAYRG